MGNAKSKVTWFDDDDYKQSDIRIVHVSDTHGMHSRLRLPPGDLLIHTGDFCNNGGEEEFAEFNAWIKSVKDSFPLGVCLVMGNHDWKSLNGLASNEAHIAMLANDAKRREWLQKQFPYCKVIDNERVEVIVQRRNGHWSDAVVLSMFGAPWNPFQHSPTHPDKVLSSPSGKPASDHDRVFHLFRENYPVEYKQNWTNNCAWRYDELAEDVDVLLTHIPPHGVLDSMHVVGNWGSSVALLNAIRKHPPKLHLFGHVHAQRGFWERSMHNNNNNDMRLAGGVEYAKSTNTKEVYAAMMPEGKTRGVQLFANSAVASDKTTKPLKKSHLAGQARVIQGCWREDTGWHFHNVRNVER